MYVGEIYHTDGDLAYSSRHLPFPFKVIPRRSGMVPEDVP